MKTTRLKTDRNVHHGKVGGRLIQPDLFEASVNFTALKKDQTESNYLMERVANTTNLLRAYKTVKANKGAPGVDGMTVDELGHWLNLHLEELRIDLLRGTYQPTDIRGVEIPKPGGGIRQLGIPTVKDRLVQQALLNELEQIFDPEFSESSYGFRPGRSAHQALHAGAKYAEEGYSIVVDLDLEKFFDRVNHDILMSRIARKVTDKLILKLIRRLLEAGMMMDGVRILREEGTPQGGPLSPLMANILLDDLDKELESRGHKFCRYADDMNIYVSTIRSGMRVMKSITRYLEERLKLKVNINKSAVAHVSERKFLGHRILGGNGLGVHPKSVERLKDKIRNITRRNRGRKLTQVVGELNSLIRGWLSYYRYGKIKSLTEKLDSWIRRKIRCYRLKQLKRTKPIAEFLMKQGVGKDLAWMLGGSGKGWWRLSKTPQLHKALGLEWFQEQGLLSLSAEYERLRFR